jgi:phosphatidylinositol 3-kinase
VWDVSSGENPEVVGGATIFLFNSKRQLKTGRQKLRLWPTKEADGGVPTTTPGKVTLRSTFLELRIHLF